MTTTAQDTKRNGSPAKALADITTTLAIIPAIHHVEVARYPGVHIDMTYQPPPQRALQPSQPDQPEDHAELDDDGRVG